MANIVIDFLHNYQTGERRESEPATAYQYDEGHVLEAVLPEVITSAELHYWIRGMEEADAYTPTSITPNTDGSCKILGNIPNKYFETNGELRVYIVVTDGDASITTYEGKLHICQRSMPDDYVDDDPENEATRVLTEAQAAATTATQQAQAASASAGQAQQSAQTLSQSVEQIATNTADINTLKEDFGQDNNLFNGVFANGYWHDKTMSTTDQYTPFQSIKIDYLPKGDYKITFENEIRVIRKVICEQIFSTGYNVSAKTPFYFNVPYDNAPLGFSFAGRSSGTSVPYSGYILIESSGETLSTDKLTARDVISEKDIARLKDVTAILDNVQISKTDDFVSGAIGASSISERNDRQCTITYYPVEKGDMVLFNPPKTGQTFSFSVARYTEPKYSGYINTIAWLYNDYGNSAMPRTPYVVTDEKYVRFTISEGNNADLSGISFGDVFYILRHGTRTMQKYNLMHGENDPISGKKPIRYTGGGSLNMGQDGTFVDGKLWCFGDGVTSGSITILDVDTDTIIGTKTHNLGHANTVDYNVNNKTLAMFYTESHKPHILLYKNPADAVSLLKTDANCMIIPLYNDNTQLSSSGGLCWGENDNVIYFMDGVYSHYEGETGIVADEINITKILLGRGDNDLSADGFGTFVSGKAENEYNGTCAIIKQFKGSMKDPMAWTVISGGSPVHLGLQTIQGMEYDGYLYIGWGTSGHNFLRIQLDDTKDTYSVDYCYRYLYTNYKNASSYYEPELCALTSDRVFCGSTGNNLLSFTR